MNRVLPLPLLTLGTLLGCAGLPLPAAESLSVTSRLTRPPEMGEVTWCDVHTKLGTFAFIPPAGWALQVNEATGCLRLHSPDDLTRIEIQFSQTRPAPANTNRIEAWRRSLRQSYPGAVFVEDFPCHTSAYPGHAFDLSWNAGKEAQMAARAVMLSCPQGAVQLSLLARQDLIQNFHHLFGALLTSFCRVSPPPAGEAATAASPVQGAEKPPKT